MTLVEELRSKKSRDNRELLDRAADEIDALINAVDNSTKEFLKLHDAYQKQKVEIEALKIANEKMYSATEETKAEVIEEYRQRVNKKMGKHTHLLGKEYVQRILREVAKEMKGGTE